MKKTLSVFLLFAAACGRVEAPAPLFPVPNARQLAWQQLETYAFVHYGLNTFNDMEWGYGDTPASTFDPADLDCDQWVRTFRAAGMKGVMLTAKHHDGFCLWPSAYTEYSVKNSPWRGGKGDLVRELSDACRRHGLKFGIYLSPWDRNHLEYGREEYVAYFHNQMRELLTGYGPLFEYWFDGANGGDGWYGGADEKRSIDAKTYYGYERARRTINELQPEAVIFGGTCADIRWIGNEEGRAGQTNWSMVKGRGDERLNDFTCGESDGDTWLPGECDVSIRPGWFYHPREDHQLKSLSRLIDIYYESVGRNANLLLNFPVDRSGRIAPADSARIMEWRRVLDAEFAHDLFGEAQATADNVRGGARRFSAAKAVDGRADTYWATDDGVTAATLSLQFEQPRRVNRILLQEYIPLGQRVGRFAVEWLDGDTWRPVETAEEMTTIGYKRIIRFAGVTTPALRVRFGQARGPLCISNVEAYDAPVLLEEPRIVRNGAGEVTLAAGDTQAEIRYTLDGTEPGPSSELYAKPFPMTGRGVVKALVRDPEDGRMSAVASRGFDIPCGAFRVKELPDEQAVGLFDGCLDCRLSARGRCGVLRRYGGGADFQGICLHARPKSLGERRGDPLSRVGRRPYGGGGRIFECRQQSGGAGRGIRAAARAYRPVRGVVARCGRPSRHRGIFGSDGIVDMRVSDDGRRYLRGCRSFVWERRAHGVCGGSRSRALIRTVRPAVRPAVSFDLQIIDYL